VINGARRVIHEQFYSKGWLSQAMNNAFYHYCSLDAFLAIIRSKEIWLTNIFCMSDSAEHYWLRKVAQDVLRRRDSSSAISEFVASALFPKEDETDLYCFCMSAVGDSLGQWRGYADDGRGVAIGFSIQYLTAAADEYCGSGLLLEGVVYDPGVQQGKVQGIIEHVERAAEDDFVRATLLSGKLPKEFSGLCAKSQIWLEAARCKNAFFEEEKEVRLIYDASLDHKRSLGEPRYRVRKGTLVPFYALSLSRPNEYPPIDEVVLGPKSDREFNEPVVRRILSDNGYDVEHLEVWSSEGTYR